MNVFIKITLFAVLFAFTSNFSIEAQIELPSFNEPVLLTHSEFDVVLTRNTRGSMAYGSDGVLHLVYTERTEGSADIGSSGSILYRTLQNERWSEPIAVRSDTGREGPFGHGGNPTLYVAKDGSVNFAWHDYRNSTTPSGLNNLDVYYRRLSPSGEFEGPEIQITSHSENQYRPSIFGTTDGRVALGWYDFLREEGPDFLLTVSDSSGMFDTSESFETRVVEDANIDKEPISGSHFSLGVVIPQFEIDSQGHLHAVWTTGFVDAQGTMNYGLMPSLSDRSMNPVIRVSETGGSFFDPPKVRIDRNDTVWIVWTERIESKFHNVWFSWKTVSDLTFHDPVRITEYDIPGVVEYPDIAVAPNGVVYIVWADARDGEWDLFFRAYDSIKAQLSDEIRLTDAWEFADERPCIEISERGEIAIVWQRTQEDNIDLFYLQAQINTVVRNWRLFE